MHHSISTLKILLCPILLVPCSSMTLQCPFGISVLLETMLVLKLYYYCFCFTNCIVCCYILFFIARFYRIAMPDIRTLQASLMDAAMAAVAQTEAAALTLTSAADVTTLLTKTTQ